MRGARRFGVEVCWYSECHPPAREELIFRMLTLRHGPRGMPLRMQPSGIVRSLTGSMEVRMLRGEIRLVDFEPSVGSEANKRRPALIVSNDHANAAAARLGRGVVTVVPLTSSTSRVLPFQVFLPSEQPACPRTQRLRRSKFDRLLWRESARLSAGYPVG